MKTQERINRTVRMIREIDRKCKREEYTDCGDTWDILNGIEGLWSTDYKPGQRWHPEPLWMAIGVIIGLLLLMIFS